MTQFQKWFKEQFGPRPKGTYIKLLTRRNYLEAQLRETNHQIQTMREYEITERVAKVTRNAAEKGFKF